MKKAYRQMCCRSCCALSSFSFSADWLEVAQAIPELAVRFFPAC